jgi:hypothetical protein
MEKNIIDFEGSCAVGNGGSGFVVRGDISNVDINMKNVNASYNGGNGIEITQIPEQIIISIIELLPEEDRLTFLQNLKNSQNKESVLKDFLTNFANNVASSAMATAILKAFGM